MVVRLPRRYRTNNPEICFGDEQDYGYTMTL